MMSRRQFMQTAAAGAAGAALGSMARAQPAGAEAEKAGRPNIVLILVDDMGFSDIGCYGSEIATPNLDRLAARGARFTHMYNSARCCPTRASLLTGMHPHQTGVGSMVSDQNQPGYRGRLMPNCVTIAEVLGSAGYRTAMSGKWHVGGNWGIDPAQWARFRPDTHPKPTDRGFELFHGTLAGAGHFFNPLTLMDQERFVTISPDQDYYYTDDTADHAVKYIDRLAPGPDPFFLYVAFTAPHWPLHARPRDIAKGRSAGRTLRAIDREGAD
jgi:arylsulfatase A-like enzyme